MATQKELLDQDEAYQAAVALQQASFQVKATDGALPLSGTVALTKGSAGAYTLAAPALAANGTRLTITSGSAFAHVITATTLINDGVTGGAKTTMTCAAFVGASIELVAYNQKWNVISKNVVTIS